MTNLDIIAALQDTGLNAAVAEARFSVRAVTKAAGFPDWQDIPRLDCVRVTLPGGSAELHPSPDTVHILCDCGLAGGDPEQGRHTLENLPQALKSLAGHRCLKLTVPQSRGKVSSLERPSVTI